MRYVNFFEGDILPKSNLSILLNNAQLNDYNSTMKFEIPDGDFLKILTISNQAIKQDSAEIVKGSTIDIDTSIQRELPNFFSERNNLLKDCHKVVKKLFSDLLSEEYTKTLKEIVYE